MMSETETELREVCCPGLRASGVRFGTETETQRLRGEVRGWVCIARSGTPPFATTLTPASAFRRD
eukprot:2545316-Rhodomonas_salina.2